MLLRASGQQTNQDYDLTGITDSDHTAGVANEEHLRRLTDATVQGDWLTLADARREAEVAMGEQQVADALVVAAAFNGITRVADATGIPLDASTAQATQTMREDTGIDRFDYTAKSARYD